MDKYQIAIYRDMPTAKERDWTIYFRIKGCDILRHYAIKVGGKMGIISVIYRQFGDSRIKLDQRSMRHYREHFDVVDMRDGLPSRYVGEGRRKEDIIELKGV